MDYEKKHQEDLEAAKGWLAIAKENNNKISIQILERLFPELRESEDERIRKALLEYFREQCDMSNWNGVYGYEIYAWLEKQGEQKSQCKSTLEVWKDMRFEVYQQASGNRHEHNCSDDSTKMFSLNDIDEIFEKVAEKQGKQKPADKVEPKFKVGNWIVDKSGFVQQVLDFIGGIYTCTYNSFTTDCESNYHLWTIDDAKDGDVLADCFGNICIFQEPSTNTYYHTHCYGNNKYFIDGGGSHKVVGTYPATKEQRDTLFLKMKEAGYEWDAEKKELKKVEQKPSWSEEDEKKMNKLVSLCTNFKNGNTQLYSVSLAFQELIDWLKSIKCRIQQRPEQPVNTIWYDNMDDLIADAMIDEINKSDLPDSAKYNRIYWINAHREKNVEWSEEDEETLNIIANHIRNDGRYSSPVLANKYADFVLSIPRNRWKPSEEQMKWLKDVIETIPMTSRQQLPLESLYNDLLKL